DPRALAQIREDDRSVLRRYAVQFGSRGPRHTLGRVAQAEIGVAGWPRPDPWACLSLSRDNPGARVSLLRARPEPPCGRRAAEQRDELAAPHSIASSASASNLSGTVRPSALAVLRLTARCWARLANT